MLSTRNFVLLGRSAFALGLALIAAAPAGAAMRIANYAWTPAAGPVAGYLLYLSVDGEHEQFYGSVNTPSAVILIETGSELVVRVSAFNAAGQQGPISDPSQPLRLCPGDFDGDETIGSPDVSRALACYQKPATGECTAADMNNDGNVTYSDLKALDLGADACEGFRPVPGCPGDIDRDGLISYADLQGIKACLGLEARGNCIDADLDGNGWVANTDWLIAGRQLGATCSN
jgi:hypothetical protein